MRLFFSIFVFLSISFLSINADSNMITEDKLTSIVEKQDMKFEYFKETTKLNLKHELALTQKSLDETNAHIGYVSDRIDNISASVDRFAMLTTFFGVLITIIVFFFSFKSNSEARQTVEDWLEENGDDFVNKEVQPIKDDFNKMIINMQKEMENFKQKSDEEIESLKEQLEEKGNEVIESLSSKIIENEFDDSDLSIEDKQYFEYQIKAIKAKPIKNRTLQDYKKMILFYIVSKDYLKANELVDKLIEDKKYTKPEKGSLYYLKGFIQEKEGLYNNAIESLNLSLDMNLNLVASYNLKARIYNVVKQDYKEAMKLAKKALEYDEDNYDAYIALGYGTRTKAYLENKHELYEKAIAYNKKAIEINPDRDLAYNNIGSIYLIQDKYLEAKEWYSYSLNINQNEWGYVNLLRIYLFLGESFPIELEEKYFKLFNKNDTEEFTKYKMFKILENIINSEYRDKEEIENIVNEWKNTTKKLRHYFFGALESWVIKIENLEIKNNLIYALELFDTHRIK
jgi:tetratricopeptide (TPR) repeat protein